MSAGVYLLCFAETPIGDPSDPIKQAGHYCGWSDNIEARVEAHRRGQGARLMEVCKEQDITFVVARIWEGADRGFERKLKDSRHLPHYCPRCRKKRRRLA